jgi:septal ring factor EnvC (AmiA/AmiB activator)
VTTELERLKVLEGKIAHIIELIGKVNAENEKLKQQVKDLKTEKKDMEEAAKRAAKLDEDVKRYENERESVKGRIEVLIAQIDKLGL